MSENQKEIVRRYIDASNDGRIDDYVALLTEDFRLIGMGMPASGVNHDMSRADLEANARAYENAFTKRITITIDQLVAEDDIVIALCHSSAITASGKSYANQYSLCFAFRGSKITSIREYCCTYSVVHVLRDGGVALTLEQDG